MEHQAAARRLTTACVVVIMRRRRSAGRSPRCSLVPHISFRHTGSSSNVNVTVVTANAQRQVEKSFFSQLLRMLSKLHCHTHTRQSHIHTDVSVMSRLSACVCPSQPASQSVRQSVNLHDRTNEIECVAVYAHIDTRTLARPSGPRTTRLVHRAVSSRLVHRAWRLKDAVRAQK